MAKTLLRPRVHLHVETLEDRLAPTADMVLQWNDITRDAIRTAGTAANFETLSLTNALRISSPGVQSPIIITAE